jgi:lycopene cyclase domain-containing protein
MKVQWLERFFTVWVPLQIPFLIVNGLLTGTGLQEPVVWYNDNENLGIRILTIPVEDTIYGFELMILTVFFYEIFKSKLHKAAQSISA